MGGRSGCCLAEWRRMRDDHSAIEIRPGLLSRDQMDGVHGELSTPWRKEAADALIFANVDRSRRSGLTAGGTGSMQSTRQ